MSSSQGRAGTPSFVERHRLWSDEEAEAAGRVDKLIAEHALEVVRLSFPDQHGILRGKTIMAADAARALREGCSITSTLLAKDTSHRTVFPVFTAGGGFGMPEMEGGSEVLMLADPSSFRVLPWVPRTGWLLCDLYFPDGRPVPFATRQVYRQALRRLADAGFDFMAGLEVEFHVFKLDDARLAPPDATWPGEAPRVSFIQQGYAYPPRRVSIRWSRSWRRCAATWWRSACRCARSRSSSGRASASSPSIRRSGSPLPTP